MSLFPSYSVRKWALGGPLCYSLQVICPRTWIITAFDLEVACEEQRARVLLEWVVQDLEPNPAGPEI